MPRQRIASGGKNLLISTYLLRVNSTLVVNYAVYANVVSDNWRQQTRGFFPRYNCEPSWATSFNWSNTLEATTLRRL